MKCLLHILCLLVFTATAQISAVAGGSVQLILSTDSDHILIGDPLRLNVVVKGQGNFTSTLPTWSGDSIGAFSILSRSRIDTAHTGDLTLYTQHLMVTGYDSGVYHIDTVRVPFTLAGVTDTAVAEPLTINVSTLPVDTAKPIMPIKAPLKVSYDLREFIWWVIVGILLVLGISALIYYLRRRPKPTVVARPRPKDPPHIWARKELANLDSEKLWQQGEVKKYYSRLSDIMRYYIEYRYDYYAMEATTAEIEQEIYQHGVKMDAGSKLMEILRTADFVKFAKMNPAPDQNTRCMQYAYDLVEMTKPEEADISTPTPVTTKKGKKKR